MCFFEDRIVGSEFSFYGPRLTSRLAPYLGDRGGLAPLAFSPLIRQDAAERLAQLEDLRLFHLRIPVAVLADNPAGDNDIWEMFAAAARATQGPGQQEVEVTLRVQLVLARPDTGP